MKNKLFFVLLFLFSVGAIILLNVGFIFLLIGFLPSVMAYMVDDDPQKNLYKCVRTCNLAGMLPTLASLTQRDYPGAALQVTMSDPTIWLVVYGSAFCGWILIGACRWVAYLIIIAGNQARILLLEQEQKTLQEEWGDAITK